MRVFRRNKKISVHAVSGTHVVLFGLNVAENALKDLLGFNIDKKESGAENYQPLPGGPRKFANYDDEVLTDANRPLIQSMLWGDYSAVPGVKYLYRVIPVYGKSGKLEQHKSVEIEISTESLDDEKHAVFFNRGVAGSQAFARQFGKYLKYYPVKVGFGNRKKMVPRAFIKPIDVPGKAAYQWLSRGLEEGMLAFIQQAKGTEYSIRASVYEFTYAPVLQAFIDALDSGVDVKIVHHCKMKSSYVLKYKPKGSEVSTTTTWTQPQKEENTVKNRYILKEKHPDDQASAAMAAVKKIGLNSPNRFDELQRMLIPRTNTQISHNKFIILLKDNIPIQIWTGSTNFTEGGIFGQSNVGHIVRDMEVAAKYMDYWEQIAMDPKSPTIKSWIAQQQSDLQALPKLGITPIFSPRTEDAMLQWYADLMAAASSSVFLTSAFTVAHEILKATTIEKPIEKGKAYQRYLLLEGKGGLLKDKIPVLQANKHNKLSWGEILRSRNSGLKGRLSGEALTGLNSHVNFLHTKYMLIDPLSEDPIVVSGSANFSSASTTKNDENMLVIRGNKRVADIFLTEFMRLFNHFESRNVRNAMTNEEFEQYSFLTRDNSWTKSYYVEGTPDYNERLLFAGPKKFE